MTDVRKDHDRAEELYEKAIEAGPTNARWLGNFAWFLLGCGRRDEALQFLSRAISADVGDNQALTLELSFYQYICAEGGDRRQHLSATKKLLLEGVRSLGWDLSQVVGQAIESGFRPKTWLQKLADVISGHRDLSALDGWKSWRETK